MPRLRKWCATVLVLASVAAVATTGHARATTPTATAAGAQCLLPGTGKPLYELWHPDMLAAIGYTDHRIGDVAFAVRTSDGRFYGYRPDHDEWSASVVKAMLMVAYLDEPYVRGRALNARDKSLLGPMITESDNDDAQVIFDTVGQGALRALANRVGMTHFATSPIWGETEITARDQTTFFLHIDSYIAQRHRAYAMSLLAGIVPSERWGIGEVAPRGWKLYFKGGWGYGTGLLDHQVALLVRGCTRVSIAVLTMYDGSHPYGKDTLKGIFARLLSGLPEPGRPLHSAANMRGVAQPG
ncbi:MAG TPA: serine hydrolase [Solirubrobacteraceae bacterium]|nr:serine hydrolase [Solirubrobacteraceae bacterium]